MELGAKIIVVHVPVTFALRRKVVYTIMWLGCTIKLGEDKCNLIQLSHNYQLNHPTYHLG